MPVSFPPAAANFGANSPATACVSPAMPHSISGARSSSDPPMLPAIEPFPANPSADDLGDLAALLRDAVEGGASIGFMLPLAESEIAAFWGEVCAEVAAGRRLLLVARADARVVGSIQLELAQRP